MDQRKIYRLLRVLEYEGELDWILEQVRNRGVKGSHKVSDRGMLLKGWIKESIVGEVPWEVKEELSKEKELSNLTMINRVLVWMEENKKNSFQSQDFKDERIWMRLIEHFKQDFLKGGRGDE